MDDAANQNELRAKTAEMRAQLEALGYQFTPSFKECVEIVRHNCALEGDFMSFDETAYRICEGGLMQAREDGAID